MTGRPIRQGDIFWLDDCPSLHGDVAKRRPVVVVSPTALVETRPDVLIVACTSSILPSNTTAIELPSRERMPQTKTGLNRRTWAVPQWLLPVPGELLVQHIGRLGGSTMRAAVAGGGGVAWKVSGKTLNRAQYGLPRYTPVHDQPTNSTASPGERGGGGSGDGGADGEFRFSAAGAGAVQDRGV